MIRHLLLVLFLLVGACAPERAPFEATAPAEPTQNAAISVADDVLPIDPAARIDTLDNGLVYYIRRNDEPKNRAELRLAIDAGSVLETDAQRGLAHFLEHMLFNGTERFPEQDLIDFLERTGMRFGPDINAYTSFDETVYMLQIPTDSSDIVEKAFDVLEDWAHAATLSDEEIEKERGVIIEEWRLSDQNAGGRIREQVLPVLLANSRYQDRLPIGDTTVIRHAPPEQFRAFYQTWYRPDLMAVVAVGDFDMDLIEARIREHFGGLENPADPAPRSSFDVPGHEETLFKVATDPEYPITTVQVSFKQDAERFETVDDYRERLVGRLFNAMLNDRLAEISRRGDAPFLGAGVGQGSIVRPSESYSLSARVQDDSIRTGLEALLTEAARVRQHGFTETELARQKSETLRAYERAYNERENTESSSLADEYVGHFLEGEPIPGIEIEYDLVQRLFDEITLEEVNAQAAALLAERNRVVIVTMPEKEGLTPPAEDDLAAVLTTVQRSDIDPYVDDVSDVPLLENLPTPAAVTDRREIAEIGVTEITLANGVRVVMKPTDFKEDEVRFTASSPGGHGCVPDDNYLDASYAATLVARSGVGAFDRTALQKMMAGKVVSVGPYVSELEEGLSGSAAPGDLETLFQLIYLYVTAPRADTDALVSLQNQQISFLQNRAATPGGVFQDTLTAALYGDHPRRGVPTIEQVQSIDLDDALAVYRDRFAEVGDFTFTFVGNFDVEPLTVLAQQYLGTLPAAGRDETWCDVGIDLPEGVVAKRAFKGEADQSQVALIFSGPFEYTRENRHVLRALEGVLDIRLREELREERAGVYSTAVQSSAGDLPDPEYQFIVFFGTDPARVEELVDAVFAEIDALKSEVDPDDVAKVREQQRRERETNLEENSFWLSVLDFYNTHPDEDVLDVLRYGDLIESLTPEDVEEAARHYLTEDRYVKVVLYPEAYQASEGADD